MNNPATTHAIPDVKKSVKLIAVVAVTEDWVDGDGIPILSSSLVVIDDDSVADTDILISLSTVSDQA